VSEHQRGERKGQFCDVPAKSKCGDCPCEKNYIDVCAPAWRHVSFPRRYTRATGLVVEFDKIYEAHHVVCVEEVLSDIIGNTDIDAIIHATKWCVNNGDNMLAMPLWGHTVMWYCAITAVAGAIKSELVPPPFANICNHDRDHRAYSAEISVDLKKLAKGIKDAGHEAKSEPIQQALTALSGKWKAKLDGRARRRSGTHQGFLDGIGPKDGSGSKPGWYQPFSMASTAKVTATGFPLRNFNNMVSNWIDKIKTAIKGGA
jgi:hypothetical protein